MSKTIFRSYLHGRKVMYDSRTCLINFQRESPSEPTFQLQNRTILQTPFYHSSIDMRKEEKLRNSPLANLNASQCGMKYGTQTRLHSKSTATNQLARDDSFYAAVKEMSQRYRITERDWLLNLSEEQRRNFLPEGMLEPLSMAEQFRFYFELECTLSGSKPCVQFHWLDGETLEVFNEGVESNFKPLFEEYGLSRYGFDLSRAKSALSSVLHHPYVFSDTWSPEWSLVQQYLLTPDMPSTELEVGKALGYPLPCVLVTDGGEKVGKVVYKDRTEKYDMESMLGIPVGDVIALDYMAPMDESPEKFLKMIQHFQQARKTGYIFGREIALDLSNHPEFDTLARELIRDRRSFTSRMKLLYGIRQDDIPTLDSCNLDRLPPSESG